MSRIEPGDRIRNKNTNQTGHALVTFTTKEGRQVDWRDENTGALDTGAESDFDITP